MDSGSFFAGWGELAFINAAIANAGRRGPFKYFLGSLVLGPIITLMLATSRENEAGEIRQVNLWAGHASLTRLNSDVPATSVESD